MTFILFKKILTHFIFYQYVFFIYPAIKLSIINFPPNIKFITFYYFFCSSFCFICFLQLFIIKRFNIYFIAEAFYYICPWHSVFYFFNNEIFFRPIWSVTIGKMLLYFDVLTCSSTLNLEFYQLFPTLKSIYVLDLISIDFILIVL